MAEKITEKEFLDALDIVKKYQAQLAEIISDVDVTPVSAKTLISDWVEKYKFEHPDIVKQNNRLFNQLTYHFCYSNVKVYVEDITWKEFRKIRSLSIVSWRAFLSLTGREE